MSDSILGMKSPSQTEVLGERRRRRRARLGIALGASIAVVIAVIGIALVRSPQRQADEGTAARAGAPPGAPTPAAPMPPEAAVAAHVPALPPADTGARPAAKPALGGPSILAKPATGGGESGDAMGTATARAKRRSAEETLATTSEGVKPEKSPAAQPRPAATAEPGPHGAGRGLPGEAAATESAASNQAAAAAITKAEAAFSGGHMAAARISATEAVSAAQQASGELRVRAYVIMGKVELASERFAEAERAFDRALAVHPDDPVARKGKERAREAAASAKRP